MSPELQDRIVGLFNRGETQRSIEELLRAEGHKISDSTISRIGKARRGPTPLGYSAYGPVRQPLLVPPPAPEPSEPLPPIKLDSEDPRELARGDWLYYERLKLELRQLAKRELDKNNHRGFEIYTRLAEQSEKRAAILRPPVPPDPHSDPAYLAASRDLNAYLEALVTRAEQNAPLGERELPPVKPNGA